MSDPNESVQLTYPGGMATVRGTAALVLVVAALAVSVVLYGVGKASETATAEHKEIVVALGRLADAEETRNWIESLPQSKRPRLLKPYSADRYIDRESP